MKKLYTFAALAAISVSAASAAGNADLSQAQMSKAALEQIHAVKTEKTLTAKRNTIGIADPSSAIAPRKAIAKATTPSTTDWKYIGEATFTDAMLYIAYGGYVFDPYQVSAYQSTADENTYLLQDVYPVSYLDQIGVYEQTGGKESTCTITFTDPSKVIATFDTYLTDTSDNSAFTSVQRYYGTYSNGTISFGNQAYAACYDGVTYAYSQSFDIVLPGAKDVAVYFTAETTVCNELNKFSFDIAAGDDAAGIKVMWINGQFSGSTANYQYVAQQGTSLDAGSYTLDLNDEANVGWNSIFAVTVTEDGSLGQGAVLYFYVAPEFNDDEWHSLGQVDFTDDTFLPLYGISDAINPYKVALYESKTAPGSFAMLDAYENHPMANQWVSHGHSHALYFTNTNEGVSIDLQPLGVVIGGFDDWSLESIKEGTIADGKLTFPQKGLAVYTSEMDGYYANQNGRFEVEIPDLLTVTVICDGAPMANAYVNFADWSGEGTYTDEEGKAYMPVPAGTAAEIMAYKDGYEMATATATVEGRYQTATLQLTAAEASLTLTVVNEEYEPVAGAWVTFMEQEYTTDESGKVTVTGIAGPAVIGTEQPLTVYKDGYEFYEGTADYTETLDALKLVVLTEAMASLTVIVNDDNYEPIAGATVVFNNHEYMTDESGTAKITDIPATTVIGTYAEVTVSAKGYHSKNCEADFTETIDAYLIVSLQRNSGIEAVSVDAQAAEGKVYDLQGRRVMQPANGTIVIMNGNKFHLNK